MGVVAFVVSSLVPSFATAAQAATAPLCDFRGASVVVEMPDQLVSSAGVPGVYSDEKSNVEVAAFCDHRGATMIAPAPQLQSEPTWLMLTPGTDDLSALMHTVVPGHPNQDSPTFELSFPDPSMIAAVPTVAPASETARVSCPVTDRCPLDGTRNSLERPPRG